ncbi:hypothetical protein PCANC_23198 [Puccinia coronata f. sp. avenae]|nr:hypothetical protein PCANC_22085 [Puccinia coronata f. sp. avenae]PLW26899.1 hypothetical protein PCANC_23198 [Puccinia coronata f. sp. avenae]
MVPGPPGRLQSKLVCLRDIAAGEVLATLGEECEITSRKAYTSVQFEDEAVEGSAHFELNSDLVYINHSCDPNVAFELVGGWNGLVLGNWCLSSLRHISRGEVLTFAYFSTEWDMAQPFHCNCGSKACLGLIRGAKYLPKEVLNRYFINRHIKKMIKREHQSFE